VWRNPSKKNRENVDRFDATDPDLNRNLTKYTDNHIHEDAVEIILHFINVK